uniref:Tyr recombinase domain-containing protein n=1 Tax=Anoplophora glabripennis TaxID=217634 RepID=V5I8P7_ANOGL
MSHSFLFRSYNLSKLPNVVARFLDLTDSNLYTGHGLRRASATLLANAGGDITTLKRHGGWKSSTVAEGYIEESISSKIDIAKKIQGVQTPEASTSKGATCSINLPQSQNDSNNPLASNYGFTINVNVNINK